MADRVSKIVLLCVASLFWIGIARADMKVDGAWIAQPPPGAMAAAGLRELINEDASPRTLVAANSDACKRIEFHESVSETGIARMEEVEKLVVPAHGKLVFALGGYHLMLIHPDLLRLGEHKQIELVFANGEKLRIQAEVRKLSVE